MAAKFCFPTLSPVFHLPSVLGTYSLLCDPVGTVSSNTKLKLVS